MSRRVLLSTTALTAGALFVVLALLVVERVGVIERLDLWAHESLHRYATAHRLWLSSMRTLTHLGDTVTIMAVDATAFVFCVWRSRPRTALFVAVAGLGTWAIRIVARDIIGRPRPADALWASDGSAFPSGHTTNAAATMAIIVIVCWPLLRRRGRVALVSVAAVYAATVGLSRVAGGVHWPSDVIGGLLLAGAVVGTTMVAFPPERPPPAPQPPEPRPPGPSVPTPSTPA